ncbi:NUDIX hydrolase [Clostridium massiliodielmoense]|uniref:NUDIX hydrolase n=1 Tax=Clostridium massiliodielmoense TaxID=1776385 RepID=UPI000166A054|nr:CoA pyrophosphatase [Clostridium massiliodielmoense]EDS77462.1 phosphohydrolase [Clostridium botulinum C str. Eklund]KEH97872.1 hydrolase [Clostridium botulinum C/D str. BKT12695]NEZ50188.1 CoA pyrophosphatase [Clostridium botulinum]
MYNIMRIFDNRKGNPINKLKKSAVMILLIEEHNELYLILEKRAITLKNQPGDISLPGGGIEEGETSKEAAIRETFEELNIEKENFKFIGEMDYFITSFDSIIYPFVGEIKEYKMSPNRDEVDHVFKVPLKFFLQNEPEEHEVLIKQWFKEDFPFDIINGGKNYKFSEKKFNQYFYKYNEYVIWGFTATIIKRFIDLIR